MSYIKHDEKMFLRPLIIYKFVIFYLIQNISNKFA